MGTTDNEDIYEELEIWNTKINRITWVYEWLEIISATCILIATVTSMIVVIGLR